MSFFFFGSKTFDLDPQRAYFPAIWVDAALAKQHAINPGVLQICVSAASVDLEGQEEAAQQDHMSTVGSAARWRTRSEEGQLLIKTSPLRCIFAMSAALKKLTCARWQPPQSSTWFSSGGGHLRRR